MKTWRGAGGGGGGEGTAVPRKKCPAWGGQYFLEGDISCLGMDVRGGHFFQGDSHASDTGIKQHGSIVLFHR